MILYKFLDDQERLTKKHFNDWQEARDYAKKNDLVCTAMSYHEFLSSFIKKVAQFEGHFNFARLEDIANEVMTSNLGFGVRENSAIDFMHKIIEMPSSYIEDWLEDQNELEWLPDYLSQTECDRMVTYLK